MAKRTRIEVTHSKRDGVWRLKGGGEDRTFDKKTERSAPPPMRAAASGTLRWSSTRWTARSRRSGRTGTAAAEAAVRATAEPRRKEDRPQTP